MTVPGLDIEQLHAAVAAGALVLTPNHRTGVQLLEAHGDWRQGRGLPRVCATPAIHPVDIWMRRCWDELLNSGAVEGDFVMAPLHELLAWKKVIAASKAGQDFLNLEAAARSVLEAYTLMQHWEIRPGELRAFSQAQPQPYEDAEVFLQWLEAYQRHCRQHRLQSLAELLERFIGALEQGLVSLPGRVILSGFHNPPPLYRRLFDSLSRLGPELRTFDWPDRQPAKAKKTALDGSSELQAAARWARTILAAEPGARVAVICPDLQQRAAEAQRIFAGVFEPLALFGGNSGGQPSDTFSVGPSSGPSLDQAPLIASALAIVELNRERVDTLDFCRLLRSPFLAGADTEADARAELEYRLRGKGETRLELASVRAMAMQEDRAWHCPVLGGGLMALETLHRRSRGQRACGDWLPVLELQLDCLGWPGERPPGPLEALQLKQWYDTLAALQELGFLTDPIELQGLPALLASLLRDSRQQRPDSQAPVQVLSPLEAEGLRFSHLWFMGLSEQHWPPAVRPNPFIPLPILKQHRVPEADLGRQAELADEVLRGLLAGTAVQAVLSRPLRNEEGDINASAAFEACPGPEENLGGSETPGIHPLARGMPGSSLEIHADSLDIPLPDEEIGLIRGGAGLLEAQSGCPFRGFALYRLAARQLPAPVFGLSAAARGELLHHALQLLWRRLRDQNTLLALDEGGLRAVLDAAVDAAVQRCARDYPVTMSPRFRELEAQRLGALLQGWLEAERQRGHFRVAEMEHKVQWRHARLVLDFRIDRVELLDDGSTALVDYKSGKVGGLKWLDERHDKPQLLLYLLAMEKALEQEGKAAGRVSAVLFAQVNIEEPCFKGIARHADICPGQELEKQKGLPEGTSWDSLRKFWESSLQALADEFLAGHLAVSPKSRATCQYCHLDSLCRVGDAKPEEAAE